MADKGEIFRVRTSEFGVEYVQICDGPHEIPMTRYDYEGSGIQPPYDELPWEDEFKASRAIEHLGVFPSILVT